MSSAVSPSQPKCPSSPPSLRLSVRRSSVIARVPLFRDRPWRICQAPRLPPRQNQCPPHSRPDRFPRSLRDEGRRHASPLLDVVPARKDSAASPALLSRNDSVGFCCWPSRLRQVVTTRHAPAPWAAAYTPRLRVLAASP